TSSNNAEIQRLENGLARQRGILAEARAKLEEQEKEAEKLKQQNEKAELDKLESKKVATAKSSYQDQLSALDLRYATETQKIELNHQLQIKKIQQMSISEK
ncbi:hypothetical protein ACMXZB_12355, partial [Pasteurella multocida]